MQQQQQQHEGLTVHKLLEILRLNPRLVHNVYLFGSRAFGTHTQSSDHDFILVCADDEDAEEDQEEEEEEESLGFGPECQGQYARIPWTDDMQWLIEEGWAKSINTLHSHKRAFLSVTTKSQEIPTVEALLFPVHTFKALLESHAMFALECVFRSTRGQYNATVWKEDVLFLPSLPYEPTRDAPFFSELINWKKEKNKACIFHFEINLERLKDSAMYTAAKHFTRGQQMIQQITTRRNLSNSQKRALERGLVGANKTIYYAIRTLIFATQILEKSAIVDFTVANKFWQDLSQNPADGLKQATLVNLVQLRRSLEEALESAYNQALNRSTIAPCFQNNDKSSKPYDVGADGWNTKRSVKMTSRMIKTSCGVLSLYSLCISHICNLVALQTRVWKPKNDIQRYWASCSTSVCSQLDKLPENIIQSILERLHMRNDFSSFKLHYNDWEDKTIAFVINNYHSWRSLTLHSLYGTKILRGSMSKGNRSFTSTLQHLDLLNANDIKIDDLYSFASLTSLQTLRILLSKHLLSRTLKGQEFRQAQDMNFLEKLTCLEHFHFKDCSNYFIWSLSHLARLSRLVSLHLENIRGQNNFSWTTSHQGVLKGEVKWVLALKNLEDLTIIRCDIFGYGEIKWLFWGLPNLKSIDLSGNYLLQDAICSLLAQSPLAYRLQCLKLCDCSLSDSNLMDIQCLVSLQSLDLTGNPHLTERSLFLLSSLGNLHSLKLQNQALSDNALQALKITVMPKLKTFHIVGHCANRSVTITGVTAFSNCTSLTDLRFDACPFSYLLRPLWGLTTLRRLSLHPQETSYDFEPSIRHQASQAFSYKQLSFLSRLQNLVCLDLSDWNMEGTTNELTYFTNLRELNLCNSGWTDTAVRNSLVTMTNLQKVVLAGNGNCLSNRSVGYLLSWIEDRRSRIEEIEGKICSVSDSMLHTLYNCLRLKVVQRHEPVTTDIRIPRYVVQYHHEEFATPSHDT